MFRVMDKEKNIKNYKAIEWLFLRYYLPLLEGFVRFVILDAKKNGIDRLYFLSRDGWYPYVMARELLPRYAPGIRCSYLHASRYSLRCGEYRLLKDEELPDRIFSYSLNMTFADIGRRAMCDEAETESLRRRIAPFISMDAPMTKRELSRCKQNASSDAAFINAVRERSRECWPDIRGYLTQEGLFSACKPALVDSGWIGTTQQSLRRLLESEGYEALKYGGIRGYYFGLYEIPRGEDRQCYKPWYFSPESGPYRKVIFNNNVFEVLSRKNEGSTVGYCRDGEKYAAVTDDSMDLLNFGREDGLRTMPDMTQTVKRYARSAVLRESDRLPISVDHDRLVRRLMAVPVHTADLLGDMYFCDDVTEHGRMRLAVALDERELAQYYFLNKAGRKLFGDGRALRETPWPEGSAVRLYAGDRRKLARALRKISLAKIIRFRFG